MLSTNELRGRFDFTLFALQCAWYEPWTAESHPTFQPGFRTAVSQLALCLQRIGMPRELHSHIVQYFSRDWWPDDRLTCWHYDCMIDQLRKREECRGKGETYVPPAVKFRCEGCRVPTYCSRACREADWKDVHKSVCGKPPYRRPTQEDYQFCEAIRHDKVDNSDQRAHVPPTMSTTEEEIVIDVAGDDDGSWESVESDDEEEDELANDPAARTTRIVNFFKSHHKERY